MSWVYAHKIYFISYSAGIDFSRQNDVYRRQILTTHAVWVNTLLEGVAVPIIQKVCLMAISGAQIS